MVELLLGLGEVPGRTVPPEEFPFSFLSEITPLEGREIVFSFFVSFALDGVEGRVSPFWFLPSLISGLPSTAGFFSC